MITPPLKFSRLYLRLTVGGALLGVAIVVAATFTYPGFQFGYALILAVYGAPLGVLAGALVGVAAATVSALAWATFRKNTLSICLGAVIGAAAATLAEIGITQLFRVEIAVLSLTVAALFAAVVSYLWTTTRSPGADRPNSDER